MVNQDRTVLFLNPDPRYKPSNKLDNNRARHHQGGCPLVQNVDAFYIREVGIGTKKNILAGKQETVLASYAGSTRRTGKMRSETSTPENQEGQTHQKGRHERRQDSKWAKCTVYVRLVKLQGKWKGQAWQAKPRRQPGWSGAVLQYGP